MRRVLLVTALLLATSLAGCAWWEQLNRPDLRVQRTDLSQANEFGYITDVRFQVVVNEPTVHEVVITATGADGTMRASGNSTMGQAVVLTLSDGTWTVRYSVDGYDWETFRDVRIDATPPSVQGIERIGDAQDGAYTIGEGWTVPGDATVRLEDFDGRLVATSLPHTVTGLPSGLHSYSLTLMDPAGNQATAVVQVRAGDAKSLPPGQHTFGIVARYTNEVRLWDISDMGAYLTPAQARSEVEAGYTGSGFGITPDDPVVQEAVDEALDGSEQTTAEVAWNLYAWLFDALEYDDERLASNTLMLPRQVIGDTEDPDAEAEPGQDEGDDGLADDGPGNGVPGGVCRDLAGTYVSMLRAAGVPARLVSGYLAGNVDGFHAWVEVYVGDHGDNPSPWMPVDVSPIDGHWDDATENGGSRGLNVAVQAFGVALPSYLALRDLPPSAEVGGWSTALSTSFSYPSSSDPPDVSFQKDVEVVGAQDVGVLCYDDETLERRVESSSGSCTGMWVLGDFVRFTERIIDYGITVRDAASGTEIEASLSYPFADSVEPDSVEYVWYTDTDADGFVFTTPQKQPATGQLTTTVKVQG